MNKIIGLFFSFIFVAIIIIIVNKPNYSPVNIDQILIDESKNLKENQEIIIFDSKNPFNFYDIFNRIDKISTQKVFGILTKPNDYDNFPIIIGVAGSAGWGQHHYKYLNNYVENGFATLSLHSFKSRNVSSTVGSQVAVTIPMIIYDAFMALKELKNHNQIDVNNSAITGWSLGGGVSLFSAWKPIQELISPDLKFSAHLPFYPPCMIMPDDLKFNNVPIHILAGELDDWVPAKACTELVDASNKKGNNLNITIYENAHHSFDREMDVQISSNAYSFTDCRMKIDNNGVVRLLNGFPLSTPSLQKIGLFFCAEKGAHWGGDKVAREKSKLFALEFMQKNLGK